ncbi:MAG: formimidoylglutamase [Bacteroidia bacterium]
MPLHTYTQKDISSLTSLRENETKLGEKLQFVSSIDELENAPKSFVVIGIPESIGVKANFGKQGAENAWQCFVKSFVNVQHNHFINGKQIVLLGEFQFNFSETNDVNQLLKNVEEIDNVVFPVIQQIISLGHTPIVIGGGHNNSYPLLKGTSLAKNKSVSCLNIDPHADFRALEGRHSGNGFSYAHQEKYLGKYAIHGLHENYNSQFILDELFKKNIAFSLFDEMLFNTSFEENLLRLLRTLNQEICLEMDADSIAYLPSSAITPSGFSIEHIRKFIHLICREKSINYLHLSEAAPHTEQEKLLVGKALSYLVTDFIKQAK